VPRGIGREDDNASPSNIGVPYVSRKALDEGYLSDQDPQEMSSEKIAPEQI